jgi:uncharacterized protein (DUF2236 family)
MSKQRPRPDDPEQSKRFIEAARELECDDSTERFVETVRKVASAPPTPRPSKAKPKTAG